MSAKERAAERIRKAKDEGKVLLDKAKFFNKHERETVLDLYETGTVRTKDVEAKLEEMFQEELKKLAEVEQENEKTEPETVQIFSKVEEKSDENFSETDQNFSENQNNLW